MRTGAAVLPNISVGYACPGRELHLTLRSRGTNTASRARRTALGHHHADQLARWGMPVCAVSDASPGRQEAQRAGRRLRPRLPLSETRIGSDRADRATRAHASVFTKPGWWQPCCGERHAGSDRPIATLRVAVLTQRRAGQRLEVSQFGGGAALWPPIEPAIRGVSPLTLRCRRAHLRRANRRRLSHTR